MDAGLPKVIEEYVVAYNEKNAKAMLATVTDDVIFENLSNTAQPLRVEGKAAIESIAPQSAGIFAELCLTVMEAVIESR